MAKDTALWTTAFVGVGGRVGMVPNVNAMQEQCHLNQACVG